MITIHENLCVRCGACANICMCGNISMSQEGPVAKNAVCIECGHCTAVCPENAIEVNGYDASDVEPYRPNILDAQTLLQAIRQRRSMRRFTDQKVSRAQIEQLIQAGRFSASAKNRQDVRYIVLDADAQEVRRMAWDSLGIFGKKNGDTYIAWCSSRYKSGREQRDMLLFGGQQVILILSPTEINGCIAAANMELMASAMGLGALYCGYLKTAICESEELQQYLGVREDESVVATLVIGYPAVQYLRTTARKPAEVLWR